MHLCVLGLFLVGQFFVFFVVNAWYTRNYLSPTIYVFFKKKKTMAQLVRFNAFQVFFFLTFFMQNCFSFYANMKLSWCHSSFIMYYCIVSITKIMEGLLWIMKFLTNLCTFCMRVISSNTLLSSAMIFLIPYPPFWTCWSNNKCITFSSKGCFWV